MTSYRDSLSNAAQLTEVNKSEPCIHCGKPDWCYRLGNLSVCKRGAEPATGWEKSGKTDKDGSFYYAPAAPKKEIRPKSKKEFFYHGRDGQYLVKVSRLDDGEGNRKFFQSHWNGSRWIKGVPEEIQQQVPIYRYQQVKKAIAAGKPVFMVEGERCADTLWSIGICATTTLGGSGKYRSYGNYQDDLAGATLILCPDRDEPGVKHMEEIAHDFPAAEWLYAPPGDFYWQHLPKSGGLDVADWVTDGATAEDVKTSVGEKRYGLPESPYVEDVDSNEYQPLTAPGADEIFTQRACDALYCDTQWIAINGELYRWVGTHYQVVSPFAEKARIATWCNSTAVQASQRWIYTYAKASYVEAIYNWMLVSRAVDPSLINPPGLNCLNGRLQIYWQGAQPSWELVPHDPAALYTYVSEFEFDPTADPSNCDRLLSCLDEPQREIFLKTLAASLDLRTIRKQRGRTVRALLCKGDGNNGKDSLREAVSLLYGVGVANTSVNDFMAYDQGRKFPLAKLEHARVSWSSENSSLGQLDNLQSLKAAITGEPINLERKNQDEQSMELATIFLFNINNVPNLQASLEAIQSRWAVLSFDKTFKANADPSRGEIEADSRFRYDPDFMKREVVPALLNKMLAVLPEVAMKAIDYSCTESALQEIQEETNHLIRFAREVGLDYQVGGMVSGGELWDVLQKWYVDNGYAEFETDTKGREKIKFLDSGSRGDRLIKRSSDVISRVLEVFTKAKRGKDNSRASGHPGRAYIQGLGFVGQVSNAQKFAYESIASKIDYLTVEECKLLISKLASKVESPVWTQQPQQTEESRVLGSSMDSAENVLDSSANTMASPDLPTITVTDSTISNQNSCGSVASGVSRDVTVKNSTKNFASAVPKFRPGDRVRVLDPKIYGIPANRVLTITKIEGDLATVTFKGCRSISGCEVPLSELDRY